MRSLFVLAAFFLTALPARAQQEQPNILIFLIDDVGHEDMVRADQLIGGGISLLELTQFFGRDYRRAYTSPTCSPTRYELVSGQLQHRDFVGTALCDTCPMLGLDPVRTTLPELLAVEGFATGLFGKAHYSGASRTVPIAAGPVHGFEAWRAGIVTNVSSHYNWTRVDDATVSQSNAYTTRAIFDAFRDWWTTTDGPKFAVVAPNAPHEPFDPPPASMLPPGYQIPATARGRYEAALVALDQAIIQSAAFLDITNTYIFVISDNGSPTQQPPPGGVEAGYKLSVHEGGIRTPFYAFGLGFVPGVDDENLIQSVDVPATVVELLGIDARDHFGDSISFAPTLYGNPGARTSVFTQHFAPNDGVAPALTLDDWAVVREDGWKLLEISGARALYQLTTDPHETLPIDPATQPTVRDQLLQIRSETLGPVWPY